MGGSGAGTAAMGMLGASADGSYVYFAANGDPLAPGAPAGETSVYLWHNGDLRFVAALPDVNNLGGGTDSTNWSPMVLQGLRTSRVTADGRYLLFSSVSQLTAYDNAGHVEFYRYDADTGQTVCVSCDPAGKPPTADAGLEIRSPNAQGDVAGASPFLPNNLSRDGGRVFFQTTDALVPSDDNRQMDVYEWQNGQLQLISTGQSGSDSYFGDASPSGNDVFFATRQALVSDDVDSNMDMYDARVGGGFPSPPAPPPCNGDDCHGAASAPTVFSTPGSTTVFGVGNYVGKPPSGQSAPKRKLSVVAVSKRARARFARTGKLVLTVTADGSGTINVTATGKIGKHTKILAKAAKKLTRKGKVAVAVHLSKAARAELHKRHRLAVRITVSMPGARSRVATLTLMTSGR
jgi:hypothetical protein